MGAEKIWVNSEEKSEPKKGGEIYADTSLRRWKEEITRKGAGKMEKNMKGGKNRGMRAKESLKQWLPASKLL